LIKVVMSSQGLPRNVNVVINGVSGSISFDKNQIRFETGSPKGFICPLSQLSGKIVVNDPTKSKGRAIIKLCRHNEEDLVLELLRTDSFEPSQLQKLVIKRIFNLVKANANKSSSNEPPRSHSPDTTSPQLSEAHRVPTDCQTNSSTENKNSLTSILVGDDEGHSSSNTTEHFLNVTVSDPQRINDYVIYRVTTRTNLPYFKCSEVTVYHRYSDFEKLHAALSTQYPTLRLPPLPAKAYMSRFNPSFLEVRCKELNQFLNQLVRCRQLQSEPHVLNFLEKGRLFEENESIESRTATPTTSSSSSSSSAVIQVLTLPLSLVVDSKIAVTVEQRLHQLTSNSAPPGSTPPHFASEVEEDYFRVRQLMKRWDLVPKKLPFEKFVVLLLGSTSAGKSALVNHLVKIPCKKSTAGQLDTMYTIVEVVSEDTFQSYVKRKPSTLRLTLQELTAPVNDISTDPRHGVAFQYLSTTETVTRYQDQLGYISQEREYRFLDLFQAVLINGAYLDLYFPHDSDAMLAKKSIFIDSPGFDSGELSGLAEHFLSNLKILQCLYTLSDVTLFLLPATQLNMVSNQVAILELSVLYANFGLSKMEELIHALYKKQTHSHKESLLSSLADLKQFITNAFRTQHEEVSYRGTAYWNKTLFLVSQIDLVYRSLRRNIIMATENLANERRESDFNDAREQYYELGRLFGKALTYLDPPVFEQCLTIGLPEHQTNCTEVYTGDLKKLKNLLAERNAQAPLEHRMEVAIQQMCLMLQETITQSWSSWAPSQWFSSDLTVVKELLNRSNMRMKGALKSQSPPETTSLSALTANTNRISRTDKNEPNVWS
jgi:hypothetical protein